MYRLSTIIEGAFGACLELAEACGVALDLDFPDPTKRVERPSKIRQALEKNLQAAVERAAQTVILSVKPGWLSIKDDGEVLTPAELAEIQTGADEPSAGDVEAKSRVGFGTEVKIRL